MGKGSKKVTVGYKYYVGMHQIYCHGPIDRLRRIDIAERTAWAGNYAGGRITIRADSLFGGDSREGGVSGAVDVEFGGPTQPVNSYLKSRLGNLVPAFRGVVGLVLRQVYMGMNPYLKPWSIRAQRIHVRTAEGIPQWYDAKAQIGTVLEAPLALYMALDLSGSMDTITDNGKTRLENMQVAINGALDFLGELLIYGAAKRIDVMLVGWGTEPDWRGSIVRRNASLSDIEALKAWVSSSITSFWTYFPAGVMDAPAFFSDSPAGSIKKFFFLTDGEPTRSDGLQDAMTIAEAAAEIVAPLTDVDRYGVNIDLEETQYTELLDNTPNDGVPVIAGSDPEALTSLIVASLSGQLDLNPAHIIRECLTDPDWGMGHPELDVDDAAFTAAADRLYSELMGISILWDRQIPIQDFVQEICRHIDAAVYVDRTTGKWVLKLIRDDYDVDSLITLGPDDIERVDNYGRPAFGELVNSVSVNYWDHTNGKTGSVTVTDTALVQTQGAVIGTTIQYPGFTNVGMATRAAQRDLRALSRQLLSCTIYANRKAADLNVGDVFKFEWPGYHEGYVLMRVTGIAFGDGRNNRVRITCSEDVYALPEEALVSVPEVDWEDPSSPPTLPPYRAVMEAPYYEIVRDLGQQTVDDTLASSPEVGLAMALTVRPTIGINAIMQVDAGAGYEAVSNIDFSPYAVLASDIGPTDQEVSYSAARDLDQIVIGGYAHLDGELVRIDDVDEEAETITIGRGVLDTTPAPHAAGKPIIFVGDFYGAGATQYADGESVNVRIQPVSGGGVMPLSALPTDVLTFDSRAIRPYPPGDLRIAGQSYPAKVSAIEVPVTWAHRDRLQQTGGELIDHTEGDIGPEDGTTYTVRVRDEMGSIDQEFTGIAGTSQDVDLTAFAGTPVTIEVVSVRGEYESWQPAAHTVDVDGAPRWTPALLDSPPEAWFNDDSNVTETGGAVAQWNDISGNGYHFSQATSTKQPAIVVGGLNGRRVLSFDGGDILRTTDANALDLFRNVPTGWMFGLHRLGVTDGTPTQRAYFWWSRNGSTTSRIAIGAGNSSGVANAPYTAGRRHDGNPVSTAEGTTPHAEEWCMVLGLLDYQNRTIKHYVNGELAGETTGAFDTGSNTVNTRSNGATIGGIDSEAAYFQGELAELIAGVDLPSQDEIDRMFGYAAWKWGLVDALPNDHPYKTSPPTEWEVSMWVGAVE